MKSIATWSRCDPNDLLHLRTAGAFTEPKPQLLRLRRKGLEKFRHCLVQTILILLRVFTRVQRLGCRASPQELLLPHSVDIETEGANLNGRTGSGCHSAAPSPTASTVSVPLGLLRNRNLIAHIQISLLIITLGEGFGGQLSINGLSYLCVQNVIRLLRTFNVDPLIRLVF